MLKNKKDHHVPEFDQERGGHGRNHNGYEDYDPMMEEDPIQAAKDRVETVKNWLKKHDDIDLALLIGSYARGEEREDSDVDLIFVVEDPEHWITETNWVKHFGPVMSITSEVFEEIQALRVYYKDDVEMEFGFTTKEWLSKPYKEATAQALEYYKVLSNRINFTK